MLTAVATITFSKQKGVITKQGKLLYEDSHETFVEYQMQALASI